MGPLKLTQKTLDQYAQQLAAHFVALLTKGEGSLKKAVESEIPVPVPVSVSAKPVAVPTKAVPVPTKAVPVPAKAVPVPAKAVPVPAKAENENAKAVPAKTAPAKPDKSAILKALAAGEASESIATRFQVSVGSVRALKAHATRGTYKR